MFYLGFFIVRFKLRFWEVFWGFGVLVFLLGFCCMGIGGNLAGVVCCSFFIGEGREDGVRGVEGFFWV